MVWERSRPVTGDALLSNVCRPKVIFGGCQSVGRPWTDEHSAGDLCGSGDKI